MNRDRSFRFTACRIVAVGAAFSLVPLVHATDVTLRNSQESVVVHESDGSYEIAGESLHHTAIHARAGTNLNHQWVTASDYPRRQARQSAFTDALGRGNQVTMQCTGLASKPDLIYIIRLYDNLPAGTIDVEVRNQIGPATTVQAIRPVEAVGARPIYTGPSEDSDRVLDDSFSEDWPPLKLYDIGKAPQGMLRAVGSQLIYNRDSKQSIFFGALRSDRLLTIMHWKVNPGAAHPGDPSTYTIDSTGTTEIQSTDPESGLRNGPAKNLIELSVPLAAGASMHAEQLMFALGGDYHSILEHYGDAIRILHHPRVQPGPMLGWWSWTAFYSGITQGNVMTNAQWAAEHLLPLGYDYFHLDLGYSYARGEYITPNAAQFPQGLDELTRNICRLGLKMGFWTAPFEVADRSWVYENHKDWLVHNAAGEPIKIASSNLAGEENLYVLDATHPQAQAYIRSTYDTLTRVWGATYIKLDFMDNTAIEGYYHRPNTTALEAQRIGLQIIRDTVGEHVLLDKDGSPMLNPVGLVDEGRLSQDTGHTFLRSKEADPGIAARYYMNHNYFLADPDAFTASKQMIEERRQEAPLTLNEAEAALALAAVSGGMYEVGDDLPTLGADPERLALATNSTLIQMVRLGKSAFPVDLLTYLPEDEEPAIFLLHEDRRQTMLAVFNWTEGARSHTFQLSDLSLPAGHTYRLTDVFHPRERLALRGSQLSIDQPRHSVRLIKIVDESVPAAAPSVQVTAPSKGTIGGSLAFSGAASEAGVPALDYHWDFGDGVVTTGKKVTHTYTLAGNFKVGLTVDGIDGVPYKSTSTVVISGAERLPPAKRYGQPQK